DGKGYAFIGILNHKLGISSTLVLTANQNPSGVSGKLLAVVTNFDSTFGVSYGKDMSSLKAAEEGALFFTSDKQGRGSTVGASGIWLSDSREKGRAGLLLAPDGSPYIQLKDKDGKLIWKAP